MAINFHKKSNIHYIPKHCSGEGDGRGKKQSSWLQKFNHEHLQTSKLLVRTLLMSSLNESYLSSKHTNHVEIQTCGSLWNIPRKHADTLEIFNTEQISKKVFKAQRNPDRQASASQLSLQHQHTWHGSTNTQQNRFAQFQYGSIWNLSRFEYFFGVVNSEYFPLGRQQWVLYEKPLTVELFRPEGQLSNILLQVVLQNISGQAALQK